VCVDGEVSAILSTREAGVTGVPWRWRRLCARACRRTTPRAWSSRCRRAPSSGPVSLSRRWGSGGPPTRASARVSPLASFSASVDACSGVWISPPLGWCAVRLVVYSHVGKGGGSWVAPAMWVLGWLQLYRSFEIDFFSLLFCPVLRRGFGWVFLVWLVRGICWR
jgi:hypothetical protein